VRPGLGKSTRKIEVTAGDPRAAASRPIHMNRPLADAALAPTPVPGDADRALTSMYGDHYRCLVRLALLLVPDVTTADDVVQDSFVAMHTTWRRLRDGDKALAYLRRSVVNRSRSVRHRAAAGGNVSPPGPGLPGAELRALLSPEHVAVAGALRSLPARQREALVLRYYGDLSEAQAASAMGVSQGALQRHLARATAALRGVTETDP
jgi:RNA polymerase sigma-70 factor (sigma-E family)